VDPATIAAVAATTLAPALPYLVKAGESAAGEAGKKALGAAWDRAVAIWNLLQPKVQASANLASSSVGLAASPTDDEAVVLLRREIRKLLQADPNLVARLQPLVENAPTTTSVTVTGDDNIATGRDISGTTITRGERRTP